MFVTDVVLGWCHEYNLPHNADETKWREIRIQKFRGNEFSYQLFSIILDIY